MVWSRLQECFHFFKKPGMMNRKVLCNTFVVLALIGLTWQVSLICQLHFAYKVTTSTTIFFPKNIRSEPLHLCIGLPKFTKDTWKTDGSLIKKSYPSKKFFDATPSTEGLIQKMYMSNKSSYADVSILNPGIDIVKVEKILYMGYMCYKFTFKQDDVLTVQATVTTIGSSGMIRVMKFSDKLKGVTIIKFILGDLVHGFLTSPYFIRVYNRTVGHGIYNYFVSHHYSMEIESMEYPYETDCLNYKKHGIMDDHQCVEYCIGNKTYEKMGQLPFIIQVNSTSNFSIFYRLFDKQIFEEIQSFCSEIRCSKAACYDYQVVTVTSPFSGFPSPLTWKHVVPAQTSVKITSRPHLTFVEFLTYILGTISTWTGLSVFAMNPFTLAFSSWIKSKSRFNHKIHDTNVTISRQRLSKCRERAPRLSFVRNLSVSDS